MEPSPGRGVALYHFCGELVMAKLEGYRVAILATNGFEQSELMVPQRRLKEEGAEVDVVSPRPGKIKGWKDKNWGDDVMVDRTLADASSDDYDALVLPGGVINPDHLRMDTNAVDFVRAFYESGKPVAAICHGPWLLVEAGVLDGKQVTSWPSLRTDITNAGADWVDQDVVVDDGLITSRKPDDLEAFIAKLIEEIQEGAHTARQAEAEAAH
jgi:protease I